MASGVSPAVAPASPRINFHGQDIARNLEAMDSAGITGDILKLLRRSTIPWPGQSVSDSSVGACPTCGTIGRQRWNGLNVAEPPFDRPGGHPIPIYGKTPKSYTRDHGEVSFHTLVLWSCGDCHNWWYHYLFHEKTRDGRSQSPAVSELPESIYEGMHESIPLGHTRSTPGRTSGAALLQQQWSPATTLAGEHSSQISGAMSTRSTASRQAPLSISTSTPSVSASQTMRGTPSRTAPSGPTSAPPSTSGMPFSRPHHAQTRSDPTRARARHNLYVDTNNVWSQYASHTLDPQAPGLPAYASPHSPSGLSPVAPTPARDGTSIPSIHRPPTLSASPPAKKVNREPESYNKMRKMLACENCRRRRKKCDPSHTGPRRPWNQRPRGSSGGASTVGEGSPNYSPELAQEEGGWMAYELGGGYGYGRDMSPNSAAVSTSPETLGMFAPPQS